MLDFEFAKQILKRVPLIPRAHGLARYARFRLDVAKANWVEARLGEAEDGLPVPSPELRYRVHGALDRASFFTIGRMCRRDIEGLLASVGQDMGRFEHVLDFGCGCGRVLRFFRDERGMGRLTGTDIDAEAMAWCRENLKSATWDVNQDLPPTRYADASFDFIYVISVFTHLDESFQFAWLEELRRILKPGGWAILTVHGKSLHGALKEDERKVLDQKGFLYKVDQTGRLKLDGLPDYYQTAYHTQDYVNQQWSRFFEVVRQVDRGICSNQDAVILQKK
jgi:ubiquinone/menaquinone biosynthesis C-methylase UbiE